MSRFSAKSSEFNFIVSKLIECMMILRLNSEQFRPYMYFCHFFVRGESRKIGQGALLPPQNCFSPPTQRDLDLFAVPQTRLCGQKGFTSDGKISAPHVYPTTHPNKRDTKHVDTSAAQGTEISYYRELSLSVHKHEFGTP